MCKRLEFKRFYKCNICKKIFTLVKDIEYFVEFEKTKLKCTVCKSKKFNQISSFYQNIGIEDSEGIPIFENDYVELKWKETNKKEIYLVCYNEKKACFELQGYTLLKEKSFSWPYVKAYADITVITNYIDLSLGLYENNLERIWIS